MIKVNKNQVELKKEVESKLNRAEEVYGVRKYSVSFKNVKSFVEKVKRLGYKVEKTEDVKNHYVIIGQ